MKKRDVDAALSKANPISRAVAAPPALAVGEGLIAEIVAEPWQASIDDGAAAVGRNRVAAGLRPSNWRASRVLVAGVACLAFGGTAMAATGVWNPGIGSQAPDTPPPTISAAPVPTAMTDALGAFRRAPNAQDRGPGVEATLSTLGSQFASGLRPDSVRFLEGNAGGEATVLLSAERSVLTVGNGVELFGSGEPACVVAPGAGLETAPECFGLDKILAGGAVSTVATRDGASGEAWGLVPDGVASITARFGGEDVREVPVTDNYFHYRWGSARNEPISALQESGVLGMSVIWTGPIGPLKGMAWHDADGNVVSPQPAG